MTDAPTVLIVDDSAVFARALGAMCAAVGLPVVGVARTVADGLAQARAAAPAVVLMDAVLPDADGFAATAALVAERPELFVIVVTAHEEEPYRALALAAGAAAFINKARVGAELEPLLREVAEGWCRGEQGRRTDARGDGLVGGRSDA